MLRRAPSQHDLQHRRCDERRDDAHQGDRREDLRRDGAQREADARDGVVQVALRSLREDVGDSLVLMVDNCLDEYTDHGHCGILTSTGDVDNDATLDRYASIAIAQADAGADVVAPSGMMDGQVGAIRRALDETGHATTAILAYAAKYASALYGPFRDAAECAPQFGDRRGYQMHAANARGSVTVTIRWTVLRDQGSTVISTPVEVEPPVLSP